MEFRLGFVENALDGFEKYVGRIAIPLISAGGVVGIRFRALGDAEPKMLGMDGAPLRLFNSRAISQADDLIGISEGEFDAISGSMMGVPFVGVTGAEAWMPKKATHHWRLFAGFRKVLIFGDGDEAGRRFANRVYESLATSTIAVRVPMPQGEDLNSMYVNQRDKLADMFEEYSR